MLRVIEWTLLLYLALKVCHLLFGPSAHDIDAPLRTRLRSGEPILAIAVFGCAGLLTVYGTWWSHRFARSWYDYSTDCYAKLSAGSYLPIRAGKYGGYDAVEISGDYFDFAEIHGLKVGIPLKTIDERLDRERLAYSAHYARVTASKDRPAIEASFADLHRCLNKVGAPRGEFFRL